MVDVPQGVMAFLANGWVSTSLFFMLSGFITSSAVGTALLIQAWVPSWIPMWNWPAWTISVMIVLYVVMPLIMRALNKLSMQQQRFLLLILPLISLLPTAIYARQLWSGVPWSMSTEIFYSNFPLFWVPYFVAGMLLTRLTALKDSSESDKKPLIALGDIAFLVALGFTLIPELLQPTTSFLRFGVLMPVYMIFIADLARGRGLVARLVSGRVFQYLGEISFSIFIWQSVVIAALFISLSVFPPIADYQFSLAIVSVLLISMASLYWIERPISQWIKGKLAVSQQSST